MDAWNLALMIYANSWVRFILALIGANALLGIAIALFSSRYTFYLGALGNWLLSRAIPYLLGWGAVKLVVLTAFGDYVTVANSAEAVTSVFVIGALLGKILEQLRGLGLPIPTWAGDQPKPESTVSP